MTKTTKLQEEIQLCIIASDPGRVPARRGDMFSSGSLRVPVWRLHESYISGLFLINMPIQRGYTGKQSLAVAHRANERDSNQCRCKENEFIMNLIMCTTASETCVPAKGG